MPQASATSACLRLTCSTAVWLVVEVLKSPTAWFINPSDDAAASMGFDFFRDEKNYEILS
ncbi:hypothetical protein BOX15_Mlig006491g1 [Macrostomum lignano]|uniref:Uncharacterized protein n=1 Tax=Macrostomum lignano TaxID=282301 RepID=A0A267DDP6_9PLAT|nr:hypothetical protein BOX15_Mlig006491g3 [Macrostomum lignano]PAA89703.1 hypothetical protein BOX15_Mlig006491g1 [Macrostomum lignano]